MPDRIRGISAIAKHLFVGFVTLDDLVLLEGEQEVQKRRRRNRETPDRPLQRDHDRMAWVAIVSAQEFLAPPLQQIERVLPAAGLIAEVVGPAAVGVNAVKMRNQPARQ